MAMYFKRKKVAPIVLSSKPDTLQSRIDETKDCSYLFYEYKGTNPNIAKNLNTTGVTSMRDMFYNCNNLTSLDLSNFDTSNVTDMSYTFQMCNQLTSLDLHNFDTSNVTNMYRMFSFCENLPSLDLSSFNTSNVTDMSTMFYECNKLTSLDLSSFDTSKVTKMGFMFSNCNKLTSLDLSNFDTSNVTDMSDMFQNDYNLTSLDLSSFNTSNVINMSDMFYRCNKLTSLDLSSFDTSKVTKMSFVISGCDELQNVIGVFNLISCTTLGGGAFSCKKLTTITFKNIKVNLQIGSGTSWGHLLTLDTLINTIKELWDYSSGTKTYTLTMGSANLEKIANTYVKLITPTAEQIAADPNINNKLPCEVCESTDEGAMLIKDYALLKNWNIQ